MDHGASIDSRQRLAESGHHAADPKLWQRGRDREFEQEQGFELPVPVLFSPASQSLAPDQSRAVIVSPEIDGPWVRNLYGHHRDVGLDEFGRDDRRDVFVSLEFEHQIDAFLDQEIGVAQRRFRAIAVVHGDQLNVFAGRHALDALTDVTGEFRIGRLRGEAQLETRARQRLNLAAVSAFADPLYQTAFDQTLRQPEAGGLAQARAFDQLSQRDNLFREMEGLQQATGPDHSLDDFRLFRHIRARLSFFNTEGQRIKGAMGSKRRSYFPPSSPLPL